MDNKVTRLPK